MLTPQNKQTNMGSSQTAQQRGRLSTFITRRKVRVKVRVRVRLRVLALLPRDRDDDRDDDLQGTGPTREQ